MKASTWKLVSALSLICMVAIAAIACFVGPCTGVIETAAGGTTPMKCHWAFVAVSVASIVGIAIALLALLAKTKEGRRTGALALAAAFLGVIAVLSPAGIGICAAEGMKCISTSYGMFALAAVGTVLALVMAVLADPRKAELPKMGL